MLVDIDNMMGCLYRGGKCMYQSDLTSVGEKGDIYHNI